MRKMFGLVLAIGLVLLLPVAEADAEDGGEGGMSFLRASSPEQVNDTTQKDYRGLEAVEVYCNSVLVDGKYCRSRSFRAGMFSVFFSFWLATQRLTHLLRCPTDYVDLVESRDRMNYENIALSRKDESAKAVKRSEV